MKFKIEVKIRVRGNNRKPIARNKKLPQFTTMNVIDGQAGLVNYSSLIFYSLTIDNILNIIVLLILAGVSIAMLTGQNGILTQAQKAKSETENAAKNEAAILDEYNKYLNNAVGGGIVEGGTKPETDDQGYFTKNSTINGEKGNADNPIIPAGFKPIDENGANWGDGSKAPEQASVENGLVIQDKEGNQFVWVPVRGEYKRNTTYDYAPVSEVAYTDTRYLPEGIQPETDVATNNEQAERETVTNKGGFYISRYEAGKETVNSTNKLVSKAGATVWTNISQPDCKTEAKKFIKNDNVKSALCSGIQWDMTMAFVNGKQDGSSDADKTYNVTQYKASRHTGSKATSGQNVSDRVCNIFDLEGNYYEYVAEKNSYTVNDQFVHRGGDYSGSDSASSRNFYNGSASIFDSFRFTLYVM